MRFRQSDERQARGQAVLTLLALLVGCASEGPAPRFPEPEPRWLARRAPGESSGVASSAPAPPPATLARPSTPVAAPGPVPPPGPPDPACSGAKIDLAPALLGPACPPRGEPAEAPAGALVVRIGSPPPLAGGDETTVEVRIENASAHAVELRVRRERGASRVPPPPPELIRGRAVRVQQSVVDALGMDDFDTPAGYAAGGTIGEPACSVTIAPQGVATMRAVVRARGFLPERTYEGLAPSERYEPQDALPRGRYKVRLDLGITWPREVATPPIELVVR